MTANIVRLGDSGALDLKKTLTGGQCFCWTACDGGFQGCSGGVSAFIYETEQGLFVSGDPTPDALERWSDYLDLRTDYDAIMREVLALEPRLAEAAQRCAGVRILRQEPWEALCSFIISQNNNIPRIRLIISRLCELCAVPALGGGLAFPPPERVAALSLEELEGIGCGYRAGYIQNAARLVASGEFALEPLRSLPVSKAREALLSLRGVGPKVADCALLFGLHRLDCFPTDVWIKRALEGEFKNTPLRDSPFAGVAQQYIFEYIRAR